MAVSVVALATGVAGVLAGAWLLLGHLDAFGPKRDVAVLVGSALPELRSRVALLSANVEAEKLFGIERHASREEQAAAYVLPERPEGSRAAAALQEAASALSANGSAVSVVSLAFAASATEVDGHGELAGTLKVKGSAENVLRLLTIMQFAGDISVRDALPPKAVREFLETVESESPLSLPAAEEFLFGDLVTYAADPTAAEQRLLRDMQPEAATSVRTLLLTSGLSDVRGALSSVASRLKQQRLWPMPLMRIDGLDHDADESWTVQLSVFGRGA